MIKELDRLAKEAFQKGIYGVSINRWREAPVLLAEGLDIPEGMGYMTAFGYYKVENKDEVL